MANGWVKSLQCKARAFEDVYHPSPKQLNNLIASSSCRKSVQNLKDVVDTTKKKKKPKKSNPPSPPSSSSHRRSGEPSKAEAGSNQSNRVRRTVSARPARTPAETFLPTLTELPEGHPSRNVVEIIFHTSWSPKVFSGEVDMIFKVQHLPKTVARFEEYREMVKSRACAGNNTSSSSRENDEDDDARCVVDGNELMRFHCLGPTTGLIYDAGGLCTFSGKDAAICTFSGSGAAHESAGGGKGGRRAMLVCRVIAGRVGKARVGFDSVSWNNGELLVFDSRAILPCFLIIYKL